MGKRIRRVLQWIISDWEKLVFFLLPYIVFEACFVTQKYYIIANITSRLSIKEMAIYYITIASIIPALYQEREINPASALGEIERKFNERTALADAFRKEKIDLYKTKFIKEYEDYKRKFDKNKKFTSIKIVFCCIVWTICSLDVDIPTTTLIESVYKQVNMLILSFLLCFIIHVIYNMYKVSIDYEELKSFPKNALREVFNDEIAII